MKPKFLIKTGLNKSFQVEIELIFPGKKIFFVVIGIVKSFFLAPGPDNPEQKRLATEDTEDTEGTRSGTGDLFSFGADT